MKPTQIIKLKTDRTRRPWQQAGATPRRLWLLFGAAALILAAVWLWLAPAPSEAPRIPSPGAGESAGVPGPPSPATTLPEARAPEQELAFIQAVRLKPDRPTRMESLQAEVIPATSAPGKLAYAYRWKVNDRIVPEAGSSLVLSPFKRGDLVSVTVTPSDGSTDGLSVESQLVAIHGTPPSLELKAQRQMRKPGQPIELELIGVSPEGGPVVFSLEPPLVPGMTIDRSSGKISWLLQPDQKGPFRFGAAVADDQGGKVTKEFDITVD